MSQRLYTPLVRLDPGWLFLLAGLAVLAATVLIPAYDDLAQARWQRDRALAIEQHRVQRLERYGAYLDALDRRDESVVLSLAAEQLNKVPVGRQPLLPPADPGTRSASVFPMLEPEPLRLPTVQAQDSTLARLATGDRTRLWLIAGGALCVLLGVLPPAAGQSEPADEPAADGLTAEEAVLTPVTQDTPAPVEAQVA
jgi:hypothetical protein